MNLARQRKNERFQLRLEGLASQIGIPVDCPICGAMKWRWWGKTRNGNCRLRCQCCGRTIIDPIHSKDTVIFGDMRISVELEIASLMLSRGNSIRESARMSGMSKDTVCKLYKRLIAVVFKSGGKDFTCPCGKPNIHRGWCSYRFKNSPARQRVMERLQAGELTK